jgi:probable HAF family extracellular repeat protein
LQSARWRDREDDLRRIAIIALILGWCGLFAPVRASSLFFTPFTVPGAASTSVSGINNLGDIVGAYSDGTGSHGFIYANGVFTTLDVPNSTGTGVSGINDAGQVVGSYTIQPHGGPPLGFLYSNGVYTTIDVPGTQFTEAWGINDNGQIVGTSSLGGFVDVNNSFTTISLQSVTFALGINNAGQVVGRYGGSNGGLDGFLDTNGSITTIDWPGATISLAYGINDSGQIVGNFFDGGLSTPDHGFLDNNGDFVQLDAPGAVSTVAYGINNAGEIVGTFRTSSTDEFGFVATPSVPEPASLILAAGGLAGLLALRRKIRL